MKPPAPRSFQAPPADARNTPLIGRATPAATARRRTPSPSPVPDVTVPEAPGVDPLIGQTPLGQYRILEKLGEGGFGAAYLAEQVGVQRLAVIKVLHTRFLDADEVVRRFEREAAVLAKLDNQHLVRLYNFGKLDGGQLFLAMEHGGDATLAEAIRANGRLEVDLALLIAQQVCEALEEAHQHAIVHRDLKPQNILLARKGTHDWVKVVDVGIAKILDTPDATEPGRGALTRSGAIIGTPAYFSPEQARGLSVDARSDLYAVGVVLYEMLIGQLPLVGLTPREYARAHNADRPTGYKSHGVDLPSWLEQLVMKALEKDPAKRFQTAQEMQDALGAAREQIFRGPRRIGLRRVVLAASGVAVAAAAATAVVLVRGTADEDPVAVEIASPVAPPRRQVATGKLEGVPAGATVPPDPPAAAAPSRTATVAEPPRPAAIPAQTRKLVPQTHALAPPPASVAPAPGVDSAAARLLEEAAQLQQQHDIRAALLRLERALAMGPSQQIQVRALRSLAELNYRGGNSRRALGNYERLRPLVVESEWAAVDARIQLLREELGQ